MSGMRKKKEKTRHGEELSVNIINSSTSTEGNINCQSNIRFDGKHKGEINAANKIVIGEKAIIKGSLIADNIEIFGLVKGDCRARNSITLSSSANYIGNIFTKQIIVLEGAVFNGNIEMTSVKNFEVLETKNPQINCQSKKLPQRIAVVAFFLMLLSVKAISQVGGVSGSKLGAYCVDVVDHHKVEFEPDFYHFKSSNYWDRNGKLTDLYQDGDSIKWVTGLNFRITYGLIDKFEIGASFSSDLLLANIGMRYIIYDKSKTGLALIAGANIPLGNKTIDKSVRLSNTITSIGGGVVFSTYLSDRFSMDFNGQYFHFVEKTDDNNKGSLFLNSDIGYYLFSGKLQLITGIGYQHSYYDNYNSHVVSVFPGITVETGKSYIIVLSTSFDVWGINAVKNAGISLALTITLS